MSQTDLLLSWHPNTTTLKLDEVFLSNIGSFEKTNCTDWLLDFIHLWQWYQRLTGVAQYFLIADVTGGAEFC